MSLYYSSVQPMLNYFGYSKPDVKMTEEFESADYMEEYDDGTFDMTEALGQKIYNSSGDLILERFVYY